MKSQKSDGTGVLGQVTVQDGADIKESERERAEKKLLVKLQEAEKAVKEDKGWLTLEAVEKKLGIVNK